MERAQQAEQQERKEHLDLPAELQRRESRKAALQQARQVIEERAKAVAAAKQAEHEAKEAQRQAQRDAGKKPRGRDPKPPSAEPEAKAQYNFTDPESRIMKAGSGQHFEQSYNAQAAVDEAMLIVGARVSTAANDKQELPANVAASARWWPHRLKRFWSTAASIVKRPCKRWSAKRTASRAA